MTVSVEEAFSIIDVQPTTMHQEIVPLEMAVGRVLAGSVTARHNLPPFDNSAMDGYAIRSRDAGGRVRCDKRLLAGDDTLPVLEEGEAIRIMTGARMPKGAECVVPVENAEHQEGYVVLPSSIHQRQHVRYCGEDIAKGDALLHKGTRLFAHHITLLASQGISHVNVFHQPKVALFASGSELKMHYESLQSHQLYNTNTPTFAARARELGAEVRFLGTAADSLESIEEHIAAAIDSDLIITSGGISVGDADFTKEAFKRFGLKTLFEKVNIKPGKPTTLGYIGKTLVLNLPGNPLAAALNFELFAKAIILKLSATTSSYLAPVETVLAQPVRFKPGRRTLIPGWFDGSGFSPAAKFAPGMISPLAQSNGFIMIDEMCEALEVGARVKVIPTRFEWTSTSPCELTTR